MTKDNFDNTDEPENDDLGDIQDEFNEDSDELTPSSKSSRYVPVVEDLSKVIHLSGMYQNYFLEYASYVILERAVPHLFDGLKPVQRRILHTMRRMEDGRYNKVANIIGHTMQFHPHGDASITDALVQVGQKDLLVDMQGNWGNIYTGDRAAAARYIEARLTKFALDVVFNPKTTIWKLSYDGRNKEPITLPVKFPLLLAQGSEGIAVGLASKILPHNFNELIDASIAHLRGNPFTLYPDFPTGGYVDVERYNDGLRGGNIKVRAKISTYDKKTLIISDLPFGKTTDTLIDSIIKANERGKIKIRKIDDNTAENVEILVHLLPGTDPDKTIDALYAFTDCEYSISPNCCVIDGDKPRFIGVSELLKASTFHTVNLLTKELEIERAELQEQWHSTSLEKIFIENEIYESIKTCKTEEEIYKAIDNGLKPFVVNLHRAVTHDDILQLSIIPIKRISKFSSFKADDYLRQLEEQIIEVNKKLATIIDYTVDFYTNIKKKYGKGRERKTELRSFETIEATQVVEANAKLYVNRAEGFIGTDLRKDEFVCDCSDIDDVLVIMDNGIYRISKVTEKIFVGKNILHIAVFKKNDERTIYNVIYRDGMNGAIMMKRCSISGLTRDKEYDITRGTKGSQILYLSVNPNGEAEKLAVKLKPRPKLKKTTLDIDFADLAIKGKSSMGNVLTKYAIMKIMVKEKGASTLGGVNIWYDETVRRLNTESKGVYLGEFMNNDKILVVDGSGEYRLTNFNLMNHYDDDNLLLIEKYNHKKIFSAIYFDADQDFYYLKRFTFEETTSRTGFIGENTSSKLLLLSSHEFPVFSIDYGKESKRAKEIVDADEFIGVKGVKAKGKRLTTHKFKKISELEPLVKEKPEEVDEEEIELMEDGDELDNVDEIYDDVDDVQEEEDNVELGKNDKGEQMTLF